MNMNQFLETKGRTILFTFLGFGVPLIFLAAQVFLSFGNLPLMILMLSWFGVALLFYMGVSGEDTI
jgi:threonine/homoserine/homoserine lactone efflux protein